MKRWSPLMVVLIALCTSAHAQEPSTVKSMSSHLDLRQAGVVIQTDWTTCGPAAVATLLASFFAMPVTEGEMAELARPFMPDDRDPGETGYTLGSLKAAVESLGLTSEGYQMELEALVAYQDRVGLPILVHLGNPQPHFAVLVGSRDRRFLVADPSWGLSVEPEAAFVASWSGYVLVTLPPPGGLTATLRETERLLQEYLTNRPGQLLAVVGSRHLPTTGGR